MVGRASSYAEDDLSFNYLNLRFFLLCFQSVRADSFVPSALVGHFVCGADLLFLPVLADLFYLREQVALSAFPSDLFIWQHLMGATQMGTLPFPWVPLKGNLSCPGAPGEW